MSRIQLKTTHYVKTQENHNLNKKNQSIDMSELMELVDHNIKSYFKYAPHTQKFRKNSMIRREMEDIKKTLMAF